MSTVGLVLLIIIIGMVVVLLILFLLGRRAQKKKAEQDEQIAAAAQQMTMLIIDKKRMKLNESGLPQNVINATPKLMRRTKVPIVKAKVGPRVMTLIADEQIYDEIPIKKEVKATVSGLYVTGVRGIRGQLEKPPKKKKGIRARLQAKYSEVSGQIKEGKEKAAKDSGKKKKK
ncbi:MAG: hypothetical protein LUI02_00540 [Clostridiales bacterium]|nr:hypothetical protein [Clostridiales bacterium]